MKYRIVHVTRYVYEQPVLLCHNEARLQPRLTDRQRCDESQVVLQPYPAQQAGREDFFGNRVLYFAVQEAHVELVVTATNVVEVSPPPPLPEPLQLLPWEEALAHLHAASDPQTREARHFALESPFAAQSAEVAAWADDFFPPQRPLLDVVSALSSRIHGEFAFNPQITTVTTPPAQVLAQRGGVCQDFAHLAIACLRSKGIPARYVSGYLETVPPPGQPRPRGADMSHAWIAVFFPGFGWVDFDPTNDLRPADRHVTTAWGRDYGDVAPLKGVIFGGGAHVPQVSVDMVGVGEAG